MACSFVVNMNGTLKILATDGTTSASGAPYASNYVNGETAVSCDNYQFIKCSKLTIRGGNGGNGGHGYKDIWNSGKRGGNGGNAVVG